MDLKKKKAANIPLDLNDWNFPAAISGFVYKTAHCFLFEKKAFHYVQTWDFLRKKSNSPDQILGGDRQIFLCV